MEKFIRASGIIHKVIENLGVYETLLVISQFVLRKRIIGFKFKNDTLYLNNEKAIFYHIAYSIEKMYRLANSVRRNSCEVVVDVGANCGIFSHFIEKRFHDARFFLFEPSRELNPLIKLNLQEAADYMIINKAVTDKNSKEDFYINVDSQETNSLDIESVEPFSSGHIKKKAVATISLDVFIRDRNIKKIDILKVDIQGTELRLIKGGRKALSVTQEAFFEVSFLFKNAVQIMNILLKKFRNYEVINGIIMGADIHFY